MAKQQIEWKRFWYPTDKIFDLTEEGYLVDPDEDERLFDFFQNRVKPEFSFTLSELRDVPCLILLGEPETGKSIALQLEEQDIRVNHPTYQTKYIDLKGYSSEERLLKAIFENPSFLAWKKKKEQNARIYFFLDNADRFDKPLLNILQEELKNTLQLSFDQLNRLFLRVTYTRTELPGDTEKTLADIWENNSEITSPNASVQILKIAPLRKIDIIQAAQVRGVDEDEFIEAVEEKGLIPFAVTPVTLFYLLEYYQTNQALLRSNQSQNLFYKDYCLKLCKQVDKTLPGASKPNLIPEQRLIVASFIASTMVFSDRSIICLDTKPTVTPEQNSENENQTDDIIYISDLIGLQEKYRADANNTFSIDNQVILETLRTNLFSQRGSNKLTWTHPAYRVFLAAWYINDHRKLPLAQLLNLLVVQGVFSENKDAQGQIVRKVIPQLSEVGAWIALLNLDFFNEVVASDPQAFFKTNLVVLGNKERSILVERLLQAYKEEKLLKPFFSYQYYSFYKKLKHPSLVDQLRPYISNPSSNVLVQQIAINIAAACNLTELQEELLQVALSKEYALTNRKKAARTVRDIGNNSTKSNLKKLINLPREEDPDDELKAYGIIANWPDGLSIQELFDNLTPPQEHMGGGSYEILINGLTLDSLEAADIPIALRWAIKQSADKGLHSSLYSLVNILIIGRSIIR